MMLVAAIAAGHDDLADLLFLVAFILAAVALVVEITARPMNVVTDLILSAVALFLLAWFVL